jgi:glycogen debranching enzyme
MTGEIELRVFPGDLFIYHDRSLLVTERDGWIRGGFAGLYEHDLRLLSRYLLLINDELPRLDALSAVDAYSTLGYYVCPPRSRLINENSELRTQDSEVDGLGLSVHENDRQVVIRMARFVGRGLHEDLEITNHGLSAATLALVWELDTDFADLFEARGGERRQTAPIETDWRPDTGSGSTLRFNYRHAELPRGVEIRFNTRGRPLTYEAGRVSLALDLKPQENYRLCVEAWPVVEEVGQKPLFECDAFGAAATEQDRAARKWAARATHVKTSNMAVQLAWDRAVADLQALALAEGASEAAGTFTPSAGQPLYGTLFGRDALTIAGQSMLFSPRMAESALGVLSGYIGSKDDDFYDEQPGRVPQQVRDNPLSILRMTSGLHDYGDYAAPCAFLILLSGHHLVAGDKEVLRRYLEPARRVLDWLDHRADLDGDGFLEYKTRSPVGQTQQGWKDSGDAVRYPDGNEVAPPIATCEVQGYVYAAKVLMAEVFLSVREPSRAYALLREAADLKRRFNERFWMPEERFIAFALDSDKKQVKTIASNAGHCLTTGIIDGRYVPDVVRRLMAPDMFSGWGIRTLSSLHPAYNPIKYHLGSVWPSENATIAFGMKRYGFDRECNRLVGALFDASTLFEQRRLPETFGGFPRDRQHPHPGIYPDACAPQGWSASAVAWLVQAILGIWSYAPLGLLFVDPDLPAWLPDITLKHLHVGNGYITVRFRRERDGSTSYKVLESRGGVRVLRQPPPGSLNVGSLERVGAVLGSLLHIPWQ